MARTTLNSLENINSALAAYRNNPDIRPERFYSLILEDTIKVPVEEYVHVQHATQSRTIPKGHQKLNLRRLGSWTPHTEVLSEGIPPRPDVTKSESIELGYTQFGRFAYFTDQIRTDVLDDFVAHYTKELADLANRTIEKFAREKLLSAPSAFIAGAKESIGKLLPGDIITIADLRLMVKKFDRNLIKTIGGNFNYICSPEFMHDLIDDPYVENYMRINQSTFNMYTNEEPFPLFKVKFYVTRLDENLAPDIDHPGEYLNSNGGYELRMITAAGDKVFSVVAQDQVVADLEKDVTPTKLATRAVLKEYYYKDGSAIENRVAWIIDTTIDGLSISLGTNVKNLFVGEEKIDKMGHRYMEFGDEVTSLDESAPELTIDEIKTAVELPINRGILTGAEGLVKVTVEGQGATQIIIKELGSAGTADPLNQLSSIGFKIQGLGFGFLRPEAVYVTYSVPHTSVAMLGLTTEAILGSKASHINEEGVVDDFINPHDLGLDGRKNPFAIAFNVDGGSAVNPVIVYEGELLAKPTNPTKASKTFAGWFSDASKENEYDFNKPVRKGFTLYAKWTDSE